MTEEEALALLESLTADERKDIPLEDFAWPEERKFPIDSQAHLDAAATLIGRAPAEKQAAIKARAIRIAKRKGFTLPDSWQDEKQESAASVIDATGSRPRKKIATLRVCFLEYNARSLNGRIYPRATCDRIFAAAQRKVANDDLPATVFVSHEAANSNGNTELVGRVARVWQEGNKFFADLDLADTRAAWDMLALAENGALKSESMRVAGVELRHDNGYDLPLVVIPEGVEPDFLGIDLTTRPGLADSARILQTLYESQGKAFHVEVFTLENVCIESKEEVTMASLPIYLQAALGVLQESSSREAHMRVHDHLAGVLDEAMNKPMHGAESARYRSLVEGQFEEAIAKKHMARLVAAHDESARQLNMKCEGVYKEASAPSDTDQDGDDPAHGIDPDNDGESAGTPPALIESIKENKTLTEEEMLAALKARGFTIEAPKTPEQQRIEEQEAKLAALEAKLAQLTESAPTQRQTLSNSAQLEESNLQPETLYQEGDYLRGDLAPKNWRALANPAVPWPKDLHPKTALKELAPFLTHRLLQEEAQAQGRSLEIEIGLNGNL